MTRTSQVPPVALYGEDAPELCNPVLWNGLATSAYHAWAFWRAEQVALAPSPFRAQNDIRIVMGMIRSLPPRSVGAERLAAILRRLLDGALAPLAGVAARPRILLALGLPERMGDEHGELRFQRERSRLVAEAFQHLEARAAEVEVEAVPTGHASFAECIERAAQGIRAGRTDVALVGGIDTGYDPEVVQKALDEGRIYDGANLDGFCPGEGGAMWLMMPRGSAAGSASPRRASRASPGRSSERTRTPTRPAEPRA